MSPLSREERLAFKRNGFVVVDGAVDEDLCADARAAVWDAVPEDPHRTEAIAAGESPGNFSNQYSGINDLDEHIDAAPFEALLEAVFPYAETLVGEGSLPAPGEGLPEEECLHSTAVNPVIRYPDGGTDWSDPNGSRSNPAVEDNLNPHVDVLDNRKPWTIVVVVLLDRVYPRGGGFTVWPGSHRLVADWFADNPAETINPLPEELAERVGPGFEVAGTAGMAVFTHN
jgi:hypothetical protein